MNNRANWNNAVNNLSTGGWTNIGDGLQKAKDMIVAAGGVTANTYIVLMTDGLNNRPSPQATADADLQTKIDDLLLSGIPVYVTCTGGDLGLQSQCAEIGTGTNGFNSDSAQASKLPEVFVDFHERITGRQAIDSVHGNFSKIASFSPASFYVDEGSSSVSFSLLWNEADTKASVTIQAPDGATYQTRSIPQGQYARIANPISGNWQMRIDPSGRSNSNFVARAYVQNRVNVFNAYLRSNSILTGEEIYIYAVPQSFGGPITKQGEAFIAVVTLPDGSTRQIELKDNGRDSAGNGDDLAKDGIFTGVFDDTAQKGAYGFQVKADIEGWQLGEDGHVRDEDLTSPHFIREISVSAGVRDPNDIETTLEDDPEGKPETDAPEDPVSILWIYIIVILLIVIIWLLLRCCCRKDISTTQQG